MLAGVVAQAGRLTLTPMLTPKPKLYGDLTVACLADDHFMLFGSGAMPDAHRRWFEKQYPDDLSYANVDGGTALRCLDQNRALFWQSDA